jgi:predicted NBD/HSP70 family sugar kinase
VECGLSRNRPLRTEISAYRHEISGIAVASYGPFLSLTPGPKFGVISPNAATPPLRALDLYRFVGQQLGKEWLDRDDTRFVIETDASACAVGEAHLRGFGSEKVLAYIFATQGIGLGIAKGKKVIRNALHPEVGLLPAYIHPSDPIARHVGKRSQRLSRNSTFDFRSIAQLSNTKALWQRYEEMKHRNDYALAFSDKDQRELFWDIRAFYLAQACIACTVVLPPHAIVIGADTDPLGDVAAKVQHHFEIFLRGWRMAGEPLFTYEELSGDFIRSPSLMEDQHVKPSVVGALGLCYLAAASCEDKKMVDASHL